MKMLRSYPWLAGVALLALGVVGMAGWVTYNAELVRWRPAFAGMVFNTALCIAVVGIALLVSTFTFACSRVVSLVLASLLILLPSLVLLQYALNFDAGIDWFLQHAWLEDGQPTPGRMAVFSCLGFMLCGVALIQMRQAPTRRATAAMHLSILGILLIGVTGLAGQSVRIDLIYPTLRWPRMSVQEAGAMVLIAGGLWALWYRIPAQSRYAFREDEKIGFIGAVILTVISLTIGVGELSVQVATLQQNLIDKLWPMLETRHTLVRSAIESGQERANSAVQNNAIAWLAARLAANHRDGVAIAALRDSSQRMLKAGLSGIALLDVEERELFRAGHFVELPSVQADIDRGAISLLWGEDSYRLRTHVRLYSDGAWVGTLHVEQPLHALTASFFNVAHIGASGELGICVDNGLPKLSCFPQSHNTVPYGASRTGRDGRMTAMSRAAAGSEGVLEGQDYRGHNIVAVYRPLAPGLGLVVKQDTAELFLPIRKEMTWALPLLVLLVGLGAFALGSLVTPIASRLLRSEKEAKEREQHTRTVLNNIAEGIITLDENGVIESFSGGASKIFGYRADEVVGTNIQNLRSASTRMERVESLHDYLQAAAQRTTSQLTAQRKDGSIFPMEFAVNALQLDERCLFVVIVRDITKRKQTEATLFEEKERLHVTLCSIGDAVITTDTAGKVTYLNPVAEQMTGWSSSDAEGRALMEVSRLINEKTGEPVHNPVEQVIRREMLLEPSGHTVLVRRDGTRFAVEETAAPILGRDGNVHGVVLVFHDVTQARKMAVQLTYQATHDDLTGLINRGEFERRLQYLLEAGRTESRQHTLLYLNLDRFKLVNDTCGHAAGDELLRQLSRLLQAPLRQSDTVARLGSDEFCVLLDSCSTGPAIGVAEALLRIVSDFRFVWQDKALPVSVSIGLVTFNEMDATVADVFRMADAACYVAKDKGRNRIQAYTPEDNMLAQRHGEVGWLERIRRALQEDRFVLHAQKIMALDNGAGCPHGDHYELLLRMVEDGKVVPPMAFIPAAERYGLMPELDRWVIRTAFANYAACVESGNPTPAYAINLSGASLGDDHLLDYILAQFERHAIPPQRICFEITETSAIANLNHAVTLIQRLKAIGCRFSLDDFGSGMSSFGYLKHLPVDYLKIDGSFVKDMIDDPIDFAMVESINNIGHVMGIRTIAEFVENDEILAALNRIGVDFAQGYGIAKPVPLATVVLESA
jgi:diguanylate cyclase (GGDEF)-like protein/PAS domain S-box-containing protein